MQRFHHAMADEHQRRRELTRDLQSAVGTGQFELFYQPIISLWRSELSGFEALIRWRHPQRGLVSPVQFIPLAEESRLILPLGEWILRRACGQAVEWKFEQRGLSMSVNVSALQFEQRDFVQSVQMALERSGLPGHCLTLELTESMVLRDIGLAGRHIRQLKESGVRFALDDFGAGYSSLSVLQSLPLDHLKMDRSFLQACRRPDSKRPRLVLETLVSMAQRLGLTVIAEGVETAEQGELLRHFGCDSAQGYFFGRPQPADEASSWMFTAAGS
ncbi:putative bifunctional diguanylate cyclase/phosphodiesterase [Deinococcus lacus]|uniref:Bifunctional diguanylate cyclase/phosphodiesterase n=1 Tax=Deinococcus lacus TaxID=392561 RepID=A0ABW1YF68_9DEIO